MSGVGALGLVPEAHLRRFADGDGRVMMERRDRGRRLLVPVEEAVAAAGSYGALGPGAARLVPALAGVDARAAGIIDAVLTGAFPLQGEGRAGLALFLGFQLLRSRGYREGLAAAVEGLGQAVAQGVGDAPEDPAVEPGGAASEGSGGAGDGPPAEADQPVRLIRACGISLAGLLLRRIWQLVRFPRPLLLTGDTPVVLWSRSGVPATYGLGLRQADELRFPLDPRHALIVARSAPAGEVVRDLGERHAAALNRTVAEGAWEWVYHHPEYDPLQELELAPPRRPVIGGDDA